MKAIICIKDELHIYDYNIRIVNNFQNQSSAIAKKIRVGCDKNFSWQFVRFQLTDVSLKS
jgi:glutathione peroxidase-family protein